MPSLNADKQPKSRRSLLQDLILINLEREPARNITQLAERMNKQPAAVSRSLKKSKEEGLVTRKGRGWYLTELGQQEVKESRGRLEKSAESTAVASRKMIDAVQASGISTNWKPFDFKIGWDRYQSLFKGLAGTNLFNYAATRAFEPPAVRSFGSGLPPQSAITSNISRLVQQQPAFAPFAQFGKSYTNQFAKSLSSICGDMMGLQQSQGRWTQLMAEQYRLPEVNLAAVTTKNIGEILADTTKIGNMIGSYQRLGKLDSGLQDTLKSMVNVFGSYRIMHEEQLGVTAKLANLTAMDGLKLMLPTTTVRDYSRSVRHYVAVETNAEPEPELETYIEVSSQTIEQAHIGEQTNRLLEKVSPKLAAKRRGAWDVLRSGGSDRLSQAAYSQREVLRLLVTTLAPDEKVGGEKPTRRQRLRYIVDSNSLAEYIDKMASALDAVYARLSNILHEGVEPAELSVYAAITTCDGLILQILVDAKL